MSGRGAGVLCFTPRARDSATKFSLWVAYDEKVSIHTPVMARLPPQKYKFFNTPQPLFLYPHPSLLNLDHDFPVSYSLFSPPTTCISLFFIIAMLVFACWVVKKDRLITYGILWFLGNLVIESSIIPLELVFEHRMYLPSMGLVMAGVGTIRWITGNTSTQKAFSVIVAISLLFSYWTYQRATVWSDPVLLWKDVASKSPNKERSFNNLGTIYYQKGMLDKAVSMFNTTLRIKPVSIR